MSTSEAVARPLAPVRGPDALMAWMVCGECGQVKGDVDRPNRSLAMGLTMYQACACEQRDEPRWRGYDFNLARELGYLFERMDRLAAWRCAAVKLNRVTAGLAPDGDLRLPRYLTSCGGAGITPEVRFEGCLRWFKVPSL